MTVCSCGNNFTFLNYVINYSRCISYTCKNTGTAANYLRNSHNTVCQHTTVTVLNVVFVQSYKWLPVFLMTTSHLSSGLYSNSTVKMIVIISVSQLKTFQDEHCIRILNKLGQSNLFHSTN